MEELIKKHTKMKAVQILKYGDIKDSLVFNEVSKPVIDKVYPFSESIEAFTHLASGRAKGKIVIKIN